MVATGESNASRFFTNELQLNAVRKAEAEFAKTGKNVFTFDVGETVGEGYLQGEGSGSYRTTKEVQAVFGRDGKLKTLFPLLKR